VAAIEIDEIEASPLHAEQRERVSGMSLYLFHACAVRRHIGVEMQLDRRQLLGESHMMFRAAAEGVDAGQPAGREIIEPEDRAAG
jgi:hypothetical protein